VNVSHSQNKVFKVQLNLIWGLDN